jgi:hypothetical protein
VGEGFPWETNSAQGLERCTGVLQVEMGQNTGGVPQEERGMARKKISLCSGVDDQYRE